jgi:hypothetical protein
MNVKLSSSKRSRNHKANTPLAHKSGGVHRRKGIILERWEERMQWPSIVEKEDDGFDIDQTQDKPGRRTQWQE